MPAPVTSPKKSAGRAGAVPVPHPLTPLVGRASETARLRELLAEPATRLVTLTGPGGVGKTRLALHLAGEVAANFVDGVVFVSLAAVDESELVLPTIARTLGLREQGRRPLPERLQSHLRDAQTLLILDNFEQVAAAAIDLPPLLAACPDVKIVVTSREALRVQGEQRFTVPLLSLPTLDRLPTDEADRLALFAANEAVALFVARARAVRHDFQLTPQNARHVAEICRRLDGLPLAIELAAARTTLLAPQAIRAYLDETPDTLPMLAGGPQDSPERQRTLSDTIRWSYEILPPEEQQLLAYLSVFAGSFTPEAATTVLGRLAGDAEQWALLDRLGRLVERSLLQPAAAAPDAPRFALLTVIRAFAAERLAEAGASATALDAHTAYYLQLAEAASPALRGPEQAAWLAKLEAEHDNLRAALRAALRGPPARDTGAATAVRLGAALWPFWLLRGYLSEGRRWLEAIVAQAPGESRETTLFARLLVGAGNLNYYQGEHRRAARLLNDGLALGEAAGEERVAVAARQGLARLAMRGGRLEEAVTLYRQCRRMSEALEDEWGVAHALTYEGLSLWTAGDYGGARAPLQEGLARFRALRDQPSIAQALQALGWVETGRRDMTAAEALFGESVPLCRRLGDRAGLARGLYGLSLFATRRGDFARARDLLAEAVALLEELGDSYHVAGCAALVANLAAQTGDSATAMRLLGATEALQAAIDAAPPREVQAMMDRARRGAEAHLDGAAVAEALAAGRAAAGSGGLAELFDQIRAALAAVDATRIEEARDLPSGLTGREVEVLRLVAQGLTNAQVAERLVVSPYTVNAHLRTIYNKLDVPSRAAATRFALEHHLA